MLAQCIPKGHQLHRPVQTEMNAEPLYVDITRTCQVAQVSLLFSRARIYLLTITSSPPRDLLDNGRRPTERMVLRTRRWTDESCSIMHVINFDWTDLGRPTRRGKCEDKQTDFPSTRGAPLQARWLLQRF